MGTLALFLRRTIRQTVLRSCASALGAKCGSMAQDSHAQVVSPLGGAQPRDRCVQGTVEPRAGSMLGR
jgi:hypothetical protein